MHVFVLFGNDVLARRNPSHLSVTAVVGQFPLVVYVTRALNVVDARPLLGESDSEVAAKAGKTDHIENRTSPAISARRCTFASDRPQLQIIETLDREATNSG
jgi:hypothetical protein